MEKALRRIIIILGICGVLVIIATAFFNSFWYEMHAKVTVVDAVQSADEEYEVILQKVGEAGFPFGDASGRLVLKEDGRTVSQTDFEIANDGASFSERAWKVTWYDEYVEIILSGEEQHDELIALYYDGEVERRRLTTRSGIEIANTDSDTTEDKGSATDAEDDPEYELFPGERKIREGYRAVYELFSDRPMDYFEVVYGASQTSSRCILGEDENTIGYLVYDGESKNGNCGLYVHYQSMKNTDGTWSYADGMIVDMYAYVYESGEVVSSGKTQWGDTGSETYREITGEN